MNCGDLECSTTPAINLRFEVGVGKFWNTCFEILKVFQDLYKISKAHNLCCVQKIRCQDAGGCSSGFRQPNYMKNSGDSVDSSIKLLKKTWQGGIYVWKGPKKHSGFVFRVWSGKVQLRKWMVQNQVQHLICKVWYQHGKAGIIILLQHPHSIFEVNWGHWESFTTPEINWRYKEGVQKVLQHPLWDIESLSGFIQDTKSQEHGLCPAHKVLGRRGMYLRVEATKLHEKHWG